MPNLELNQSLIKDLQNKHYGIAGKHSAVQICEWTKKSLRNQGECYKHWFYGIETFNCCQVSPNVMWCDQNCIFCWRPQENMQKKLIKEKVDSPKKIIEDLIKAHYKLLSGFKGYPNINKKKLEASLNEIPSHWAISLSGEPTLYPKLPEFIKTLQKKGVKSIFLVSNGQNPTKIKDLHRKKALPTQLYISLDAWNEHSYRKINKGIHRNAFKRLLSTIKVLNNLACRTVIRLTVIKGLNDNKKTIKEFGKLIEFGQPDFLEIKAYMWLGYSRKRLKQENMPSHDEIKKFARALEKYLPSMKYEDENIPSRILLYKNNAKNRKKKIPNRYIIPKKDWRFV
ncbi:MAG: 4-demethylwyosine synthase TYW1 [Candidatus Diapherotrites archaeon CG08_land_8_20_14_0_20_30_16]|nr:MAG: 4-demethylwyosine synthase TYW1 [Candidatus Diapherotrites archaeon CG08_land_8_20_14_0_20_30_16]